VAPDVDEVLLDHLPDAIIGASIDGAVLFWSKGAEAMFGYTRAETVGHPLYTLIVPPDRVAEERQRLRDTIASGFESYETVRRKRDGSPIQVDVTAKTVRDPRTDTDFVLYTKKDVTDRKRFESALRETRAIASHAAALQAEIDMRKAVERRLGVQYTVARALAETSSVEEGAREVLRVICESLGFANGAVWEVDRDADRLRCLEVWCADPERQADYAVQVRNSTLERHSGLAGRAWATNRPVWIPDMAAEPGFPNGPAAVQAGLGSGVAFPVTSGGDVIGVMRLLGNDVPALDAELIELFGALSNQIGQFIERRRQQQSFHYLFHHNPLPMWVLDRDSLRFLEVNDAALRTYGFSRDEFMTMHLSDIRLPEDVALPIAGLTDAGNYHATPGRRHRRKDGGVIDIDIFGHNFTFEGRPARLVLALDVTARKAAEAQLRQALKMESIGHLTGGMAHDFNNLLSVIMGNLDLMRELRGDDREIGELVSEAEGAAIRGADLIRSLLAFARRQPLQPKRSNLNALVTGIAGLLSRTLGEQIEISLDLAPDPWSVSVDPVQLETALVNLATNARDAMSRGGRLTIGTSNQRLDEDYCASHAEVQAGDYAVLQVSDTGAGIPAELQARIFEPFVTTKEQGKGTGLGLSMVFGFMRQSGGHINLYSEIGVGTTFRLYLPRDASAAERSGPIAAEAAPKGNGETVLVVEDNDALRRLVLRQLRQLGYQTVEAENAVAALALLQDGQAVDLLFTDLVMAGAIGGIELARTVTARWPDIRILLTSGFSDTKPDDGSEQPVEARLLSKPYQKQDLARAVRAALDGPAMTAAAVTPLA
jgi:PAS domain S-box-containing protein